MQLNEEWRDIPGYPGYQISSVGRARSNRTGSWRILKPRMSKGYLRIHTSINGKAQNLGIHRAICLAFHGEPGPDMLAAHNDGDRLHNEVSNLRWATQAENAEDRGKHGNPYTGSNNPHAKLSVDDVAEILSSSESGPVLARRFGVSRTQICRIRNRKSWQAVDVTTLRQEAMQHAA